ncbi:hypothetical protein K443DRAFT_93276, partial [Laccaria amethystina LaAM-08-1]
AGVIGFKALSSAHSGDNLGRYTVGLLECVDNTGNNNTTCQTIQDIHTCRGLMGNSTEQQLPYIQLFSYTFLTLKIPRCLGHVVNLGNVDVMQNITKVAAVENATAIWEYDPTRTDNCVLGSSFDVIVAIRTLAIKIQASGQQIEFFQSTQLSCGLPEAVKIPLHSNI